ncbi:MAG TPA: carboxypeptidase-like regulatory domain-containing protein [Candidatus Acidoferrum sp.]|nr:carboxypeptidase-like regulatory domain-containing protein [Candidatus Acidoferrum sp.]
MLSKRVALLLAALFCLFVLTPTSLFAQATNTGTVSGTVTDPSGAAVIGATVTLTDTSTNIPRTAATNESGRYIFVDVAPGTYNVSVNKTGFRVTRIAKQAVSVGLTTTLNVTLEVGSVSESVEVTATNTEIQTMNATVGNTVSGIALNNLPSVSRDAATFVVLQPGVTPDGSVAGAVMDQNSFSLDGGQNTNDMDGSMNIYTPSFAGDPSGVAGGGPTGVLPTPIDSVEEFKSNTTNQTADFNSSAGSQVSMVTKRGTNNWHGTVYEYYLNNKWNANTFDNNAASPEVHIPLYHYSRFGAAGGGPIIPKKILGGKTYFFANYQGFRWPNSATVNRAVPSDGMKLGLLQFGGTVYNLNPGPVTYPSSAPAIGALVPGTTYPGSGTTLDPRGIGISSAMTQLWNYMPESNSLGSCLGLSRCDKLNVLAFTANMSLPQTDNFGVARLDHDFGDKWHFMSSYRYYRLNRATNSQVNIGGNVNGLFPSDKLGVPASLSSRPQDPWFYVAALTTNISTNVTNDLHYSYLRNYWSWVTAGDPAQIAGMGGALEPFGETSTQALAPYNVNAQNTRTRFWDGQDHMFRDDLSILHGNHFFTLGGTYQRNWNYHQRTDNGGGINYYPVYQVTSGINMTTGCGAGNLLTCIPAGVSSATWSRDYAAVLGIAAVTQIAYTRSGSNLALNPALTPASDKSTIPYYNVYWSDSWHMKPTFTLTYGLGWTLEMPPVEAQGKQVELVDSSGQQLNMEAYLKQREMAALAGQVYNPEIGFALVGNTGNGQKYPYNPFYGSFSPRVAAAWNPNFDNGILGKALGHGKTAIRGGFSIIYGRLNGVDLVLVPLLGTGLIQPVQCFGAASNGTCGAGGTTNPFNAFRVGNVDGLSAPIPAASPTLPQPTFPGFNSIAAGAGEALDPNFRPSKSYQFDLTIQRQLSNRVTLELGYIGRKLTHEYQPININTVPYMMTLGGQRFDKAYSALVMQYCGGNAGLVGGNCGGPTGSVVSPNSLTPQPFFEAALGGPTSAYCSGFSSCTAAVAANEGGAGGNLSTQNVWSLWSDLDNGAFVFPRTMMNTPIAGQPLGGQGQATSGVGVNASVGYSNYNAAFVTIRMADWHGLTLQSNFTYGKALGTGAEAQATSEFTVVDPYNLHNGYGVQPFDRKFVYNALMVYEPPFFKGQKGLVGRVLGGWSVAPILSTGSGLPLTIYTSSFNPNVGLGGQSYGEADAVDFGAFEQGVNVCSSNHFGTSRINQPTGGVYGSSGFTGPNGTTPGLYSNPGTVYNCFRNPILGLDSASGAGTLRGQPFWNVDVQVRKNIQLTERFSFEFQTVVTNVFNHVQLFDPFNQVGDTGDWGALEGQQNTPRQFEFGLRLRF